MPPKVKTQAKRVAGTSPRYQPSVAKAMTKGMAKMTMPKGKKKGC